MKDIVKKTFSAFPYSNDEYTLPIYKGVLQLVFLENSNEKYITDLIALDGPTYFRVSLNISSLEISFMKGDAKTYGLTFASVSSDNEICFLQHTAMLPKGNGNHGLYVPIILHPKFLHLSGNQ